MCALQQVKYIFLSLSLCLCLSLKVIAQEKEEEPEKTVKKEDKDDEDKEDNDDKDGKKTKLRPYIGAGMVTGGMAANGKFIYKTGKAVQMAVHLKASKRVYYGLNLGAEFYRDETFLPVGVSFLGYTKGKNSSPFLTAQLGYAAAFNEKIYSYADYNYYGGIFFSPGAGYKIEVKDKYNVHLGISYRHQFSYIEYKTPDSGTFKDENNFHLVSFTAGFLF